MSDAKHTPAPWSDSGNEPDYWPITDANGYLIANVWRDTESGKSNARLIAAAPDLLAACEAALDVITRYEPQPERLEIWGQLKDTIAKAKGGLTP